MIRITITIDGAAFDLSARGHAGFAQEGPDIVCAGVSTLLDTLADNMAAGAQSGRVTVTRMDRRPGDYRLAATGTGGELPDALPVVARGLRLMEATYPRHVGLTIQILHPDGAR